MRRLFTGFMGGLPGAGLLLVRLVMGLAFILHGWPKHPARLAQNPKPYRVDECYG
jgi:uncharacterized membrane protein YphA (DoxX/SURF4 family)